MFKLKDIFY